MSADQPQRPVVEHRPRRKEAALVRVVTGGADDHAAGIRNHQRGPGFLSRNCFINSGLGITTSPVNSRARM